MMLSHVLGLLATVHTMRLLALRLLSSGSQLWDMALAMVSLIPQPGLAAPAFLQGLYMHSTWGVQDGSKTAAAPRSAQHHKQDDGFEALRASWDLLQKKAALLAHTAPPLGFFCWLYSQERES